MKSKILLLLTVITFLTACESNENINISITSADLIGTWNVTSQTVESTNTVTSQGTSATYQTSGYGKDYNLTYTFSEDPNILKTQGGYTFVVTTNLPGQPATTQETPITTVDGLDSGSWSLNDTTITVTDNNNQSSIIQVTSFTGNVLKLKISVDQEQDLFGTNIKIVGESFVTLEK